MEITTMLSLAGPALTIIGLVLTATTLSRRIRSAELHAAEEKGKMLQRLDEVERDINHLGDRQRRTDESLSRLQQDVAAMLSSQNMIVKMLKDIGERLDRHVERQ